MPAFKLRMEVTDPNPIIEYRLKKVIADKINLAVQIAKGRARLRFKQIIEDAILSSPEAHSLMGGELQGELGVETGIAKRMLDKIVERIDSTIQVDIKQFSPFGNVMRGYIEISIFPKALTQDLLDETEAEYITKRGETIPWLSWLLTLGDRIIVRNYSVDFSQNKGSRTGLATMVNTKRRGWRVPPQFSGTRTNNFITRALDDVADLIAYHLKLEFIRAL